MRIPSNKPNCDYKRSHTTRDRVPTITSLCPLSSPASMCGAVDPTWGKPSGSPRKESSVVLEAEEKGDYGSNDSTAQFSCRATAKNVLGGEGSTAPFSINGNRQRSQTRVRVSSFYATPMFFFPLPQRDQPLPPPSHVVRWSGLHCAACAPADVCATSVASRARAQPKRFKASLNCYRLPFASLGSHLLETWFPHNLATN